MSFAPIYLVCRPFFRIAEFLRHWYVDGARWFILQLSLFSNAIYRRFGIRLPGPRFARAPGVSALPHGILLRAFGVAAGAAFLAAGTLVACLGFAVWASVPVLPIIFAVYGIPPGVVVAALRTLL